MARRTKLEPHLTSEELKQLYRTTTDASERNHFQVLWLIAQGQTQAQTARLVGLSERWVQVIVKRYNAGGVEAMRDRRHDHPGPARALDVEGELDEQEGRSVDSRPYWSCGEHRIRVAHPASSRPDATAPASTAQARRSGSPGGV
jgi:hypothetical protein